jgi:hypothetical protein
MPLVCSLLSERYGCHGKQKKSGWHAQVCNGISIVSLVIGVWTTTDLG